MFSQYRVAADSRNGGESAILVILDYTDDTHSPSPGTIEVIQLPILLDPPGLRQGPPLPQSRILLYPSFGLDS